MGDTTKILNSLVFIASRFSGNVVSSMKAYKLIWLADRLHLRKFGRTITGDRYFALPKGLVPTDAKHLVDDEPTVLNSTINRNEYIEVLNNGTFKAKRDFDPYFFSKTDIDTLTLIVDNFGHLSAKQLSAISHKYPEWLVYKSNLENENLPNSYQVDMNLFFENRLKEDDPVFNQSETELELAKDLYNGIL